MTDLRTAAQAVIDLLDRMDCGVDIAEHDAIVEALCQALAKPVEPVAPVAWINVEKRKLEWNTDFPVRWETPTVVKLDKLPLYTTPPSVDALIAEIDGLDGVSAPFATESDGLWIDADELKVILDKYRGVK